MSSISVKELSHPAGEVIKIAAGKTLDLKTQGSVTMPTGSVLQVVEAVLEQGSASVVTTSQSYVTTGLTASITPKQVGSKIIATASGFCPHSNPSASNKGIRIATYAQVASGGYSNVDGTKATASQFMNAGGWLDTMGMTQSMFTPSYSVGQQIDVSIYFLAYDSTNTHYFHHSGGAGADNRIRLILQEIAG